MVDRPSFPGRAGIDLRRALDGLFRKEGRAHWVIYRRYDLSKPSSNFVDFTKEAVQGPKYSYTDELIDVRSTLYSQSQNLEFPIPPALVQDANLHFFLRHTTNPKIDDEIFEITYTGGGKPATIPAPDAYGPAYNITAVFPMRDAENGRTEFYLLYVKIKETR